MDHSTALMQAFSGLLGEPRSSLEAFARTLDYLDLIAQFNGGGATSKTYRTEGNSLVRGPSDSRICVTFEQQEGTVLVNGLPLSELVVELRSPDSAHVAGWAVSSSPHRSVEILVGSSTALDQPAPKAARVSPSSRPLPAVRLASTFGSDVPTLVDEYVLDSGETLLFIKPHPSPNYLLPLGVESIAVGDVVLFPRVEQIPTRLPVPYPPEGLVRLDLEGGLAAYDELRVVVSIADADAALMGRVERQVRSWATEFSREGYFGWSGPETPQISVGSLGLEVRMANTAILPIALAALARPLASVGILKLVTLSVRGI